MLRLWHVGHGLPDLTEEAFPFRHALALWSVDPSRATLNPHWFAYPSLTIYVQFALQQAWYHLRAFASPADFLLAVSTDPSPFIILGRLASVAADVVTVVTVGRITRRFGMLPAVVSMGFVALAPAFIVPSRLIYADNLLAMFCALALAAMLDVIDRPEIHALMAAAAWVGLAAGSKYPGALMVVPLVVVAVGRTPRWSRAAAALGFTLLVFLATSPFILPSWPEFARDARLMQETTTSGTLGDLVGANFGYYGSMVLLGLGWIVAPLLASSLVATLRGGKAQAWLPWVAFACLWIPVASTPVQAARYGLPSLVIAAVLAGHGLGELLSLRNAGVSPVAQAALGALLLGQPAWTGWRAAAAGGMSTGQQALSWCREHVSGRDVILSEAYGPTLLTVQQKAAVMGSPVYAAATAKAQAAYAAQRAWRLVWLPLLVGGRVTITLTPTGPPVEVYPHAVDWNAAVYDPRFLAGVDFMIVTSTVRDRFAADTVRFAKQKAFYGFLDGFAGPPIEFRPAGRVEGPTIAIYRLGAPAGDALRRLGYLDTLWWARPVPERYQSLAEQALAGAPPSPHSSLPRWIESLRPAYRRQYGEFVHQLASDLLDAERPAPAKALATSALAILPADLDAARVCVAAAYATGEWRGVSALLERSKGTLALTGDSSPDLELGLAQALLHEGQLPRARALLDSLQRHSDPETARLAGALLLRAVN